MLRGTAKCGFVQNVAIIGIAWIRRTWLGNPTLFFLPCGNKKKYSDNVQTYQ